MTDNLGKKLYMRVKGNVEHISTLFDLHTVSEAEIEALINLIRESVQDEALQVSVVQGNKYSIKAIATGVGKSKIGIDRIKQVVSENKKANIYIVVPTQKLRDEGWKNEFKKWKATKIYNSNVKRICYDSLNKIKDEVIDLLILDEIHNITPNSSEVFKNNTVVEAIGLTATPPPKYHEKTALLNKLGFVVDYILSLEEATKLRLVAPFKIKIIELELDTVNKNIKSGNPANPFYQTEAAKYKYLDDIAEENITNKFAVLNRMRFIYDLPSKNEAAKFITSLLPKEERSILFCSGIEQTIELCSHRFFSRPTCKQTDPLDKQRRVNRILAEYRGDMDLKKFIKGTINQIACVNSLDEGHNIPKLDIAFVIQGTNSDRKMIQRIGRFLRNRLGHEALIIILCVKGTVDERWINNALQEVDKDKIERIRFEDLKNGVKKIW